jgi:Ca-activated chloride channel family protein
MTALALKHDAKRPYLIVFLTDGKPTIGESDTDTLVANVKKGNDAGARIFVFGVGEEINTHLLDRISGQNGGLSHYVKPDEDIEVKVSSFADKISQPVLSHVKVEVDKLKIASQHPKILPDLFGGDQLTIFGRYQGKGDYAIRLTGDVNGAAREFVYEGTFPDSNPDNEFIPRLWATRRVGYLLDEIRLRGESGELKDEVIRLSREFGIMTPYTSYLVLENDQEYINRGISRPGVERGEGRDERADEVVKTASRRWTEPEKENSRERASAEAKGAPAAEQPAPTTVVPVFDYSVADADGAGVGSGASAGRARKPAGYRIAGAKHEEIDGYLKKQSGNEAIKLSEAIQGYKDRLTTKEDTSAVRHVGSRIFYLINGVWVDSEYKEQMKATRVSFASDEYFKLLADKPEIKRCLALGEKVIVCLDKDSAVIIE